MTLVVVVVVVVVVVYYESSVSRDDYSKTAQISVLVMTTFSCPLG